jgi:hypothetical protein
MTQPFRLLAFSVLVALQGVACAGANDDGTAEPASSEVDLRAVPVAPHAAEAEQEPERAELLSPSERDEQLAAVAGSEPGGEALDELEVADPVLAGVSLEDVLADAARLLAARPFRQ